MNTNKTTNQALYFILLTVLIDATGLSIIIPIIPEIIAETTKTSLTDASKLNGILIGIYALMQFLFAPILGGLSDKYGRRPVLLISLFGLGLDYLVLAFAPNLLWLIIGRMLSGICGSSFTVANSYVADISSKENRTQNFGLIAATFGTGFILGPAIGGLASSFGVRFPLYLAAFLSFLNVLYGLFVLKESLAFEDRRPFDIKRANPLGAFSLLKRRPNLSLLFIAFFVFYICEISIHSTWNFFTSQRYNWDSKTIGWSLTAVGFAIAIVQGGLIGKLNKKWGVKKSILFGIVFSFIGLVGFGLSNKDWMLYIWILPYALSGFVEPSVKSVLSSNTSSKEQGELLGSFTSFMSLASIISPLLMTSIYHYTVKNLTPPVYGSPYFLSALLLIIVIPLFIKGIKKLNN